MRVIKRGPPQKHGMYKTRVYSIWKSMVRRCMDPDAVSYPRYGGAGITLCDSWLLFPNFYRDMGDPPTDKHQIDRRDPTRGYEPGNVRWVTRQQQNANVRKTSRRTTSQFKGVSHPPDCKRWMAAIYVNRRPLLLGWFDSEESAARAYDIAAIDRYGEFAQLNFPPENDTGKQVEQQPAGKAKVA